VLAEVSLPAGFATGAFAAGLAGIVLTAWLVPRRWAASSFVLWGGLMCLLGAGLLGVGSDPADGTASGLLAIGALGALTVAGVLLVLDLRARDRQIRKASADAEVFRRDIDRLNGINVRLEDEVREVRQKVRSEGEQRAGSGLVLEQTLSKQRKALDTATLQLRRQRAIFEGAVEGMALLERETLRMAETNPSLARISGLDAKELAEKSVLDLFAAGPARPGKADLQRCAREKRTLAVTLLRKEGQEVPVELTISVAGEGDDAQLLVCLRDVSDRSTVEHDQRALEQQLKDRLRILEAAQAETEEQVRKLEQANRRLAEISDRKDHYVSSVSHELRTPLTSIRSFAEILLKHGDTEPGTRREFVEIIHKESERLTRLVNNVLDLARIEAGATKLLLSEFDARVVAADAVASMQGTAAERGVRVTAVLGDDTRPIRADRDRVQQVLMNLVSNAIKFSASGSAVELRVEPGELPGRVRFAVADHGKGIPAEDLDRVFDRFHRVDDEPGTAGTGLGLAICREIADLHGGRVWVESVAGEGSTFRIELPGVEEMRARRGGSSEPSTASLPRLGGEPSTASLPRLGSREAVSVTGEVGAKRDGWSTTGSLPPLGKR
jgi:PAS domain S-box-containing protein